MFELFAALGLAALGKAIYKRAWLAFAFLAASVVAPLILIFVGSGELPRWLAAVALGTALVNVTVIFWCSVLGVSSKNKDHHDEKKARCSTKRSKPCVERRIPTRLTSTRRPRGKEKDEAPEKKTARWAGPASNRIDVHRAAAAYRGRVAACSADTRSISKRTAAGVEAAIETPPPTLWLDRLAEYKRRKAAHTRMTRGIPAPGAPFVPGALNWLPLGPTVVLQGQTVGDEPIAGRICSVGVAPGGQFVYAAASAGGVFRSDDGGHRGAR